MINFPFFPVIKFSCLVPFRFQCELSRPWGAFGKCFSTFEIHIPPFFLQPDAAILPLLLERFLEAPRLLLEDLFLPLEADLFLERLRVFLPLEADLFLERLRHLDFERDRERLFEPARFFDPARLLERERDFDPPFLEPALLDLDLLDLDLLGDLLV